MNIRNRIPRITRAALAAVLAAGSGAVLAAGEGQVAIGATDAVAHANAGARLGVEERLREELRVVVMDLIQSGAFGATQPREIALDIDTPAEKVSNLGLLVDSASAARDGLHVLGVTPGGSAERMGLRAGDVLLAVNGNSLASADSASTLRQTVDAMPDGTRIDFDVRRGARTETVNGTSSKVFLPAMHLRIGDGAALAANAGASVPPGGSGASMAQGCGRISDFDVAPRQQHLHAAKIISIDGHLPGPTTAKTYRVDAGTHEVKVSENIENRYLSFNDRLRNAPSSGRYKTISVDVAADTTYFVAARLNEDQRNNAAHGAYWDPVVWRETPESCR